VGRRGDVEGVEREGPTWLGDVLLANKMPAKDPVKVSFVLLPWGDLLPGIAGSDGNSRLNANRMLRVKKILAYVAERIEILPNESDENRDSTKESKPFSSNGENPEDSTNEAPELKPEEFLDLYCYDQKLPITMSLATLRAHVWKGGADVMLYYKSNGKVRIKGERLPESEIGTAS